MEDVLLATDAVALAVEIADSRLSDWRIKLVDTIADNASYGAVMLGEWQTLEAVGDLRLLGCVIEKNGEQVAHGVGAAALGHPASAVAWLANKLAEFGVPLNAGDVVISGAVAPMSAANAGDTYQIEMLGFPNMLVHFT